MNSNISEYSEWTLKEHVGLTSELARQFSDFRRQFTEDPGRVIRTTAPEYYTWKLRDNPYGRGLLAAAYSNDDQLIATFTSTWRCFYYEGKWRYCCKLGDIFTDPDYRGRGISTILCRFSRDWSISQGAEMVYNTPNELSIRVASKVDMEPHPHLKQYFWLLPLTSRFIRNKERNNLLSKFTDSFLTGTLRALSRNKSSRIALGIPEFGTEFDHLNKELCNIFCFHFDKSSKYLTYRYARNPDREKYQLITYRNPELQAVLICKATVQWGLEVLSVVDWFGKHTSAMRQVWLQMVRRACDEKYDMIANWVPFRSTFARAMGPAFAFPYKSKTVSVYNQGFGASLLNEKRIMLFSASEADFI